MDKHVGPGEQNVFFCLYTLGATMSWILMCALFVDNWDSTDLSFVTKETFSLTTSTSSHFGNTT